MNRPNRITEDWIDENLPDGWYYDCHWANDGMWFLIYPPYNGQGDVYDYTKAYILSIPDCEEAEKEIDSL